MDKKRSDRPSSDPGSSRVCGLRARVVRAASGRETTRIDVNWRDRVDGRLRSTSYYIGTAGPIEACRRAMERRMDEVGAVYEVTPRQAWLRLRRTLPGGGDRTPER